MTCHEYEKKIMMEELSDDVLQHIESCPSCQSYQALINTINIHDHLHDPSGNIDDCFHRAEKIQKRKNIISLMMFICLATVLMSTVYFSFKTEHIIWLQGISSVFMPISLFFSLIKRKVVIQ